MAKITLTNDDGSTVDFLDPAGVQAAIDAAVAAFPQPLPEPENIASVEVVNQDGSSETFVPETPAL